MPEKKKKKKVLLLIVSKVMAQWFKKHKENAVFMSQRIGGRDGETKDSHIYDLHELKSKHKGRALSNFLYH